MLFKFTLIPSQGYLNIDVHHWPNIISGFYSWIFSVESHFEVLDLDFNFAKIIIFFFKLCVSDKSELVKCKLELNRFGSTEE